MVDTKKASLRQIRDLPGHLRTTTTDLYLASTSISSDLIEAANLLEERGNGESKASRDQAQL
jgi:hypothetical protein